MEQSDDHNDMPQQLLQPQSTYQRFSTSVLEYVQGIVHPITHPTRPENDGGSPSSPTFPGAYPVESSALKSTPVFDDCGRPGNFHQDPSVALKSATPQPTEKHITSTFQDARDVNISGNPHFLNVGKMNVHNYGVANGTALASLKEFVSFGALHDSSEQDPERQCHPGTRESVLKQIRNWVDDPNTPERILWLHGPAGVGKSAIAQSISNSYGQDRLAATFFFFRSDSNRNDGNRLFPTLSWQLTTSIPRTSDGIADALSKNSDLPRKAVEIQFERLIFQPLKNIVDSFPQVRALSPVIIIDGVDECSGDKLQQRFLKTIGKAITDSHFPLRFLISSRPEAHIEEVFNNFLCPVLRIDLASIDGWRRDIEIYLTEEFSRIALEQKFDATIWPGQKIIQDFVDKSSGQFVYASTIIRFVGDEYSSALAQLEIIMGLRPADGASPFAYLDALYMEILQRQPHQKFLKDFLAILVARSFVWSLGKDDAILLNVEEHELRRKLRGMYSVLKFKDHIDLHHRSFLDFLQDPNRSGQYHISKQSGTRRYLELITDAVVRYGSRTIKKDDCDGINHFSPEFGKTISYYPRVIDLPLQDWEETLWPLFKVKDDWLKSSTLNSPWKRSLCSECTGFHIIDNLLLQLSFFRGTSYATSSPPQHLRSLDEDACTSGYVDENGLSAGHSRLGESVEKISTLNVAQVPNHSRDDFDGILASFLTLLRTIQSKPSTNTVVIDLLQVLLRFDPSETASRICSVLDAERIFDFIFKLDRTHWDQEMSCNAARLALGIYARVPFLPPLFFIKQAERDNIEEKGMYQGKAVRTWELRYAFISTICHSAFVWGILSHSNVCPFLGLLEQDHFRLCVYHIAEGSTFQEWRDRSNPPRSDIKERIIKVARVVRYMQSVGISICDISQDEVFVDANSDTKLLGLGWSPQYCVETPWDTIWPSWFKNEGDVAKFGCYLHKIYLNEDVRPREVLERRFTFRRPSDLLIPDYVWQLIQRCLAEEEKDRPTIDEVIEELESWP